MSCCAPGTEDLAGVGSVLPSDDEVAFAARDLGEGMHQVELSVPGVHCAACIQSVEKSLRALDTVENARVNLSTRRVSVRWRGDQLPPIVGTLARLGYPSNLFDDNSSQKDKTLTQLLIALGVSAFASGNIMLLSVSVWSGAEGATRDLFHWVSALIVLPAMVLAGGIYYRSAWSALRHGRMNMDVPIAVGITMAYALSIYDTIHSGANAYFDASATLLFFLLIGRTLDHVMRNKARAAVAGLTRLAPRGALVLGTDGARDYRPINEVEPGMQLLVAAGERIPVDSRIVSGTSDLDCSLVNGESAPQAVSAGAEIQAGTLNLTGPLTLEATATASSSFLAEMVRLMEAAEGGRARYRRIADRVATLYSPVVHLAALLTFIGWVIVTGDWHHSATIAIAVLIITCPCALGLAVPIVQIMAARRLYENGIMVRDGAALERMTEAGTVIFAKTGTLTLGQPVLVNAGEITPEHMAMAAALAVNSRHPMSQAIATYRGFGSEPEFDAIEELPGFGMEARSGADIWRLGRAGWAGNGSEQGTVLALNGEALATFAFQDRLRADARATVATLKTAIGPVEMLSGDTRAACARVAADLELDSWRSGLLPAEKVARIEELQAEGNNVLMIGDGLNDAPALGAAHVSMAPATAADIGRNAADFVFLRDSLKAVPLTREVSRRAARLIRQNLYFAFAYNVVAVPIALLGYVTPLVAAIAMSGSSIVVIGNALRLRSPDSIEDVSTAPESFTRTVEASR